MEEKEDSKGIVDKVVNDLSKSSITKQMLVGATAGWFTGFITVRVGKAAAFAVGGSVLLLQVAHHQGYIKVNWDKVYKHVDKVADKVEKEATGQSPKWMEKV
ncbi:unnamed protein product [Timema podura]|uniref:FUN14 domain-containing protein 1 n=2 Tax=Timema TaxID=61471 RepID=A0A7R9PP19_TIMGE|nr:unnamed protein product [Timema genevievae]CAG2054560.1 unnamed protein product [Timema podura]